MYISRTKFSLEDAFHKSKLIDNIIVINKEVIQYSCNILAISKHHSSARLVSDRISAGSVALPFRRSLLGLLSWAAALSASLGRCVMNFPPAHWIHIFVLRP